MVISIHGFIIIVYSLPPPVSSPSPSAQTKNAVLGL